MTVDHRHGSHVVVAVDAAAAYARPDRPDPPAPTVPERVGQPASLHRAPPRSSVRPEDLVALATDAAHRAFELLTGPDDELCTDLDIDADLARRTASVDEDDLADLAATSSRTIGQLRLLRAAWLHGGPAGVEVLSDRWTPDVNQLDLGMKALTDAGYRPRRRANRVSADDIELRLDRQQRWYRFERSPDGWMLNEPPRRAADDRPGRAHLNNRLSSFALLPSSSRATSSRVDGSRRDLRALVPPALVSSCVDGSSGDDVRRRSGELR